MPPNIKLILLNMPLRLALLSAHLAIVTQSAAINDSGTSSPLHVSTDTGKPMEPPSSTQRHYPRLSELQKQQYQNASLFRSSSHLVEQGTNRDGFAEEARDFKSNLRPQVTGSPQAGPIHPHTKGRKLYGTIKVRTFDPPVRQRVEVDSEQTRKNLESDSSGTTLATTDAKLIEPLTKLSKPSRGHSGPVWFSPSPRSVGLPGLARIVVRISHEGGSMVVRIEIG